MDPLRSFEKHNAQEWDDVSDTASVVSSDHPPVPSAQYREPELAANALPSVPSTRAPAPARFQAETRASQSPVANRGPPRGAANGFQSPQRGNYRGSFRGIHQTRPDPGQLRVPNRGSPVQRGRGRPQVSHKPLAPIGPVWADPEPLKTTRRAEAFEDKQLREEEEKQYKQAPNAQEYFPSIAYYLWPSNKKGQGPRDILGQSLEELDKIRVENKVFVWPISDGTCLKICSRASSESSNELHQVIHAIRQVIRHRHAVMFAAEPTLVAIPPTPDVMTTVIKPARRPKELKRPYNTRGVRLGDEGLSEQKKSEWISEYPQHVQACRQKFEKKLTGALNGLQTYRGWMRMRLRFGQVILHDPMNRFTNGKQWWGDFVEMTSSEHMKSTLDAKFDDPMVVKLLRDAILEKQEHFKPVDGRNRGVPLKDLPFKFTEVISLNTATGKNRIEVEIDVVSEAAVGTYQVGAMRNFDGGNRNKRLQMTIVDAQKQLDWALDIVTDNEIDDELPPQVLKMVQESANSKTRIRRDAIGAPYPGVRPLPPIGATITEVVVKSVIEYAIKGTDYIVELTLFRTWLGSNTTCEPTLSAGVAMYHRSWDDEMGRLTATEADRIWPRPLKTFFSSGVEKDETDSDSMGVNKFFAEVGLIQDMLIDAIGAAKVLEGIRTNEEITRLELEQLKILESNNATAEAMQEQVDQKDILADIHNAPTRQAPGQDGNSSDSSVDIRLDFPSGGPPSPNTTKPPAYYEDEDLYGAD